MKGNFDGITIVNVRHDSISHKPHQIWPSIVKCTNSEALGILPTVQYDQLGPVQGKSTPLEKLQQSIGCTHTNPTRCRLQHFDLSGQIGMFGKKFRRAYTKRRYGLEDGNGSSSADADHNRHETAVLLPLFHLFHGLDGRFYIFRQFNVPLTARTIETKRVRIRFLPFEKGQKMSWTRPQKRRLDFAIERIDFSPRFDQKISSLSRLFGRDRIAVVGFRVSAFPFLSPRSSFFVRFLFLVDGFFVRGRW